MNIFYNTLKLKIMKKNHVLILAVLFTAFNVQIANAKIWRVNNKSNYNGTSLYGDNLGGTASYPVFAQIDQAVGWASTADNDTIYVEGSTSVYTYTTLTKKLVLIGTGYFLTENPKTTNDVLESKITRIYVNVAGCQIIGMNVAYISNTADGIVYISANDVTVKRCRLEKGVQFATSLTNVYILENFFSSVLNTNAFFTNGNSGFVPPTNITFNNNICQKVLTWNAWPIQQCNNNVFDGPANVLNLQFTTSEFTNNILKPTNASVNINSGNTEKLTYNIGTSATQFGTANGNKVVADMTTLFVTAGTTDGKYKLQTNSPGSHNGSDGTDRGAFGGSVVSNRYTLSGLAAIPVIYKLTTSGVATQQDGLSVTISARTIK